VHSKKSLLDLSNKTKLGTERFADETSLLDKAWNKNPKVAITNAHKLTEIELLKLLQKVAEMPEKKLEKVLI